MNALDRYLAPLVARIRLMVAQALVTLVDDGTGLQQLQLRVLRGETRSVNRLQNYGHTSVPLAGAQAIVLAVGGNRSHLVAVAVDDARYRMTNLAPGESALHNHLGDYIIIREGRIIEVVAGAKLDVTAPEAVFNCSSKVTLNTPLLAVSGAIEAGGDITSAGNVADATSTMQAMRDVYDGHNHGSGPPPNQPMS